jgi:hypothetical protein
VSITAIVIVTLAVQFYIKSLPANGGRVCRLKYI